MRLLEWKQWEEQKRPLFTAKNVHTVRGLLYPHTYTHLFTQERERNVQNATLRAVRAKAHIGVYPAPQPEGWG